MTRRNPSAPPPRRKVPAFVPVPLRTRADGWTPLRQAEFLGYLAETRSVAEAARRVNMARETAYRLRSKPGAESFAAAWDAAMGRSEARTPAASKVTGYELWHRAFHGLFKPVMRGGRYAGTLRKSDSSALLRVVARPGLAAGLDGEKSRKNFADPCDRARARHESFTPHRSSAKTPPPAALGEAADET
jgi:hypothetical protein